MPSPSPGRVRGPIVRQLSLQNPTPLQSSNSHKGLKKQLSEDDTRNLEPVEVTGQGWMVSSDRSEPTSRISDGKAAGGKISGGRPKPVKVAWADRKQDSMECPVGVVATKCRSQPRPMSVKAQRLRNPLLGNKDTLVYSRLQLAERLRNAWSEREKIKPNLNIFLAQGSDTTRSETNEHNTDRTSRDSVLDVASTLSDTSAPLDKKRKAMQVRALFPDQLENPLRLQLQENFLSAATEPPAEEKKSETVPSGDNISTAGGTGRYLQELNKIEIRVTKIERPEGDDKKSPKESPRKEIGSDDTSLSIKRCRNKENQANNEDLDEEISKSVVEAKENTQTAQDRRANFRRSSILHKTITESFSSKLPKEEEKHSEITEEFKQPLKPSLKKPPLLRAFSAPSQNGQDLQKSNNQQKKVRIAPQRKLQPTVSFDIPEQNEDAAALRERIKSAPTRRKLKAAAARRNNKEKDSSDDEKDSKEPTSSKKSARRGQLKNGGEIITMVSLVSPAASDTEDSVINLPEESWSGNDKDETQSTNSSTGETDEAKSATLAVQKFVSLRKTPKTVSFQPHPALNRSYSASFPSRRAPAGTPIIIPTPVINNPALTPAQILEREKRNSMFSAINSGSDGRGIKRRLLRSFTEPPKEEETFSKSQKPPNGPSKNVTEDGSDNEEEEKSNEEPEFKSAKERECWNLYQKMIEKGVSVSFDTVLRGMLTPTEYRLRKNSLLSTH